MKEICRQQKDSCSFRALDLTSDAFVCNFHKEYWKAFNDGGEFRVKSLLRRTCEWVQKEDARLEFIVKLRANKILDLLEKAQVGDTVFCEIAPYHEVILLEKPTDDSKFVPCQAPTGRIIRIQACHLSRISKGNFSGEFFIQGVENEKRAQELKYKVGYYGFKAEIEKKNNGFLLKIYGDSQQEVDDFIILSLEQDNDISPYI